MFINSPIHRYLDELAAKRPVPGGGSAAALTASIGTSLMLMVANYTIGNAAYKSSQSMMKDILARTKAFDRKLRQVVDEDAIAYNRLARAMKRGSKDGERLERLFKGSSEPPFSVCELSGKCMKLCRALAERGNKKLATDTAIAAILLEAAFLSARFNVYINLNYVKDTDYIAKRHKVLAALEREIAKWKEEIVEICEDAIA